MVTSIEDFLSMTLQEVGDYLEKADAETLELCGTKDGERMVLTVTLKKEGDDGV